MAVKSCRGRAIDWHRASTASAAGRTRKVACSVTSSSPSEDCTARRGLAGCAVTVAVTKSRGLEQEQELEGGEDVDGAVECGVFVVGTNIAGEQERLGFNSEGGHSEEPVQERERNERGWGWGFNAKTTYLGKVSCFVSVMLLLLYSSWCCYLLKGSNSNSSSRRGSYPMSPAPSVNSGAEQPDWEWNAVKYGHIFRTGDWPLQSGAVVDCKMTLLVVVAAALVASTIMMVLFCSLYPKNQIMKATRQQIGNSVDDKSQNGLFGCMQICQDFIINIIKGNFKIKKQVKRGGGGGVGEEGLTPNLQVLSDVDRFSSRSFLSNAMRRDSSSLLTIC